MAPVVMRVVTTVATTCTGLALAALLVVGVTNHRTMATQWFGHLRRRCRLGRDPWKEDEKDEDGNCQNYEEETAKQQPQQKGQQGRQERQTEPIQNRLDKEEDTHTESGTTSSSHRTTTTIARDVSLEPVVSSSNISSVHIKAFPWEADVSISIGKNTINTATPNKHHRFFGQSGANTTSNSSNSSSAEQQLDFLAGMTFANGGLRAPSCPCCF